MFFVEVFAGGKCLFKSRGRLGTLFTFTFVVDLNLFGIRVFCTCDGGFQGSFQFSPALGLWLKMGNLLNQEVQRVPFYAEKGLYCTVGATWNI